MLGPGFGAEMSVYRSSAHYRPSAGMAHAQIDAGIILTDVAFIGTRKQDDAARADRFAVYHPESRRVSTPVAVLPMSEPRHQSFPSDSSQCSDRGNNCAYAAGGCVGGISLACQ